jgi:hypothetical protein
VYACVPLIGTKVRRPRRLVTSIGIYIIAISHLALRREANMAILQLPIPLFHYAHPALILTLVPALLVLVYFIPWLIDPHGLRSFPGPWLARFSDLWLGRVAKHGHRSEVVHQMHEKYGELRPQKNLLPDLRGRHLKLAQQGRSSVSHQTTSRYPILPHYRSFTLMAMAL